MYTCLILLWEEGSWHWSGTLWSYCIDLGHPLKRHGWPKCCTWNNQQDVWWKPQEKEKRGEKEYMSHLRGFTEFVWGILKPLAFCEDHKHYSYCKTFCTEKNVNNAEKGSNGINKIFLDKTHGLRIFRRRSCETVVRLILKSR